MADHLDGPFMEAWLRAVTGINDWIVHTSRAGIAARTGNVFLSVQPDTWQASQAWERELAKRGMLDLQRIGA